MSTQPQWSHVDDETADLLALVSEDRMNPGADEEWGTYLKAVRRVAATRFGIVRPNDLRPLIRGKVAPRRIGAFTHRAISQGLVEYTGDYEISDDTEGRNGGKPARVMRWVGGAA